jgi:predicted RNase H-like nuclease (RuvC/YqgF family)
LAIGEELMRALTRKYGLSFAPKIKREHVISARIMKIDSEIKHLSQWEGHVEKDNWRMKEIKALKKERAALKKELKNLPKDESSMENQMNIVDKINFMLNESNIPDSGVMKILSSNLKKTYKKGGPVGVVTRGNMIAFSLAKNKDGEWDADVMPNEAKEYHMFKGKFEKNGKWKVEQSAGVGKVSGTTVSDEDAVKAVKAIFNLVK